MPERRIGSLDTPDKCQRECVRLYRAAWKGQISWADAREAAAVLERLANMIASNGDREHGGGNWSDVGQNALRR